MRAIVLRDARKCALLQRQRRSRCAGMTVQEAMTGGPHAASPNLTPPSKNESPDTAYPLAFAASHTAAVSQTLNVRPLMISLAPATKRKLPLASLSSGSPL